MTRAICTNNQISNEQWEDFVEKFDENKDGKIDYEEFKKMMESFHSYIGKH